MSDFDKKAENAKDKVVGKTKEIEGRATGNQEMEFMGILQYQKGNLKEKVEKTKDKITEIINDPLNK